MTKHELIKRLEKMLKHLSIHDPTTDMYVRGYGDACTDVLKLAKNLEEEEDRAFTE